MREKDIESIAPTTTMSVLNQNRLATFVKKGGVPFFWAFTLSLMYSSLRVTIPAVLDEPYGSYVSYLVYLIFIESVMNWFLIARVRKLDKNDYKGIAPGNWKNCEQCETVAPPRSHHCPICNVCILRRDHHCYFTGSCVGHNNQRRFIVLLLYLVSGSIVGFVLNMMYINITMPLTSEFMYYLPMLSLYRYFFVGDLTVDILLIMLQGYLCVFTLVSACGYLAIEIMLTVKGQTQFESDKNIVKYKENVIQNVRTVFGSLWLLPIHFVLPIAIPLPNKWENQKIA